MRNDSFRYKLFHRRALVMGGIKASLMLVLLGRLYFLQFLSSEEFKVLSDSNRIRLNILVPPRGKLLDRFGRVIADNQNYYRVLYNPHKNRKAEGTLNFLSELLGLTLEEKEKLFYRAKHNPPYNGYITLQKNLTWQQVARVEVNTPDLPGISIDVAQIRHYPKPEELSHILGYVDKITPRELENSNRNPLYHHPDFKIGRSGIERELEHQLRGTAGVQRLEADAFGMVIRELSREQSIPGTETMLSIDADLQAYTYQELDKRGGSATILDLDTGGVLALCSTPGFDSNAFADGVSYQYWQELNSNPYKPLTNKALADRYPPGSTFKLMVALAVLESGIDPHNTVSCPGYYRLGRRAFHCWKEGGHGQMNLPLAIKNSCNVYFFSMANKMGIDKIIEVAKRYGLDQKTGINLPNEISGFLPSEAWKEKALKEPWQKGDTLNTAIGQGFVEATPLGLAVMVARLATGKRIVPTLTLPAANEGMGPFPAFEDMVGNPAHLELVRGGMYAVMNEAGGTAYGSRIAKKEFEMAGKTGTSQVVAKTINKGKKDHEIEWENRNHALFVGFAPYHKPKYATCVVVEHGGSGSRAAAPVAKKIMTYAQENRSGERVKATEENKPTT